MAEKEFGYRKLTFSALALLLALGTHTTAQRSQFTSAFTNLTKCRSGLTRKQQREAEKNGQDIPTRCTGFGGYDVYIYYSACSSNFSLRKGEENIPLAAQSMNWNQKTLEWRRANGKPFAVILRVYEYGGTDLCATAGKVTGEFLIVKGLKGYKIDEKVDVKSTPNANVKARQLADKNYAKNKPE
jgi:hypothetical protein